MGVQSFGDAPTERLWSRQRTKRLDPPIERTALRKLVMLDAAGVLDGLKVPPGNRLDALKADRAGQTAFGPTSSGGSASSGPGRHRERRDHRLPLEGGTHMATLAPIHPGEVLLEEFLVPLEVTQHRLAVSIGVPRRRINEIVYGKRRITANTALRLARFFATTDRFWLNLQTRYDLEIEKDRLGGALDHIQPLQSA